jgi:hypothetical protein
VADETDRKDVDMVSATGALTPVAPDRLDVAVTRSMVLEMLNRRSTPTGQPLAMAIVGFQCKTRILIESVSQVSAEPECHHFRSAAEKVVIDAHTLLLTRPHSLGGSQHLLCDLARMIVRLCGVYDLMEGGDTCPPMR